MSTIICFTAMCQGLIQGKVPPILLPSCRACCLMPCAPLRPPPWADHTLPGDSGSVAQFCLLVMLSGQQRFLLTWEFWMGGEDALFLSD